MQPDPFGNLRDWGPVLEHIYQLGDENSLSGCQPGLIRILRYRDNWRLREETLKRIGKIEQPDDALVNQVLNIIEDGQLYYEVRILAIEAMMEFLKNVSSRFESSTETKILTAVDILISIQQPPIFELALKKLYSIAREKFSVA